MSASDGFLTVRTVRVTLAEEAAAALNDISTTAPSRKARRRSPPRARRDGPRSAWTGERRAREDALHLEIEDARVGVHRAVYPVGLDQHGELLVAGQAPGEDNIGE
jgi:hypothetical protein